MDVHNILAALVHIHGVCALILLIAVIVTVGLAFIHSQAAGVSFQHILGADPEAIIFIIVVGGIGLSLIHI